MKRILLFAMTLLTGVGFASADEFTVSNITVPQGKSAVIEVGLNNTENECTGFQFLLTTGDDGITASNPQKGSRLASGFNIALSEKDGGYQLLSYNMDVEPATGTSGTVTYITLTEDGTHEVGATINATLTTCRITATGQSISLPDVNFTITVGEPRLVFDENSEVLPNFTAGDKDNVMMLRTIKAGRWNTIVLPFTLTKAKAEAIFGSDMQLAEFADFATEYDEEDEEDVTPDALTLNFTEYKLSNRKSMTGGKPFLIKTSKDITSFEADEVTLVAAVDDVNTSDDFETSGKMTGTFVKSVIPDNGLFLSDNKFYYSAGKTNVKAFRAWFELGAVLGQETDFSAKIRFVINEEPSTIEDIPSSLSEGDGEWYTLDGRKLSVKPTQKGVYIVNGKKVLIQ